MIKYFDVELEGKAYCVGVELLDFGRIKFSDTLGRWKVETYPTLGFTSCNDRAGKKYNLTLSEWLKVSKVIQEKETLEVLASLYGEEVNG